MGEYIIIFQFHYLLPDGKGYSVDVYDVDFSDREYFKKSINGESYISDIIMDRTTGKPCVYYAVPIFKENKVIASVALGIYTDQYNGMLDLSFFDNEAVSLVVDHTGQVVIHGKLDDAFNAHSNIFDGLNADKSDIEKMKENMQLGKANKIIFNEGIEERHLIYTPVGIKDWYIVTLIPNDIIDMRSQSVQNEAILLAVAFTSVLLGLILYISIEEKKHMKENQSNQNKLIKLSIAVEQSPVSIVMANLEGNIEYANQAACRITGYNMDELIGKNPNVLKSGETSSDEYKELWDIISHGSEWRGTFHNKRKNGQFYWESAIIAPIINSENQIINYLAIKEDITARKMIEDELLKFKTVSEQANYGICITDLKGMLIYVND
ncbi:hypothetical protein DIC82_12115 [Clostridium beijerinckii]|nr:hypothetical protein DIC82_12115 [Clostridium beijerinckii]